MSTTVSNICQIVYGRFIEKEYNLSYLVREREAF